MKLTFWNDKILQKGCNAGLSHCLCINIKCVINIHGSFLFYIHNIQDLQKKGCPLILSRQNSLSCFFLIGCGEKIINSRDLDCQWTIWGKWLLPLNCFYGRARVRHPQQIISRETTKTHINPNNSIDFPVWFMARGENRTVSTISHWRWVKCSRGPQKYSLDLLRPP